MEELTIKEINARADAVRAGLRDLDPADAILVLLDAVAAEIVYKGFTDYEEVHVGTLRRFIQDHLDRAPSAPKTELRKAPRR